MGELSGKVAIVTGASSGIGRASALLFAREGAAIVAAARRRPALDELVAEIEAAGGRAVALAGDVREEAYASALVDAALGRFGGLDVALNNAGMIGSMKATAELSLADWREIMDTNLTSAFLGAKHQIPALLQRGGGSLIFTSSFVGSTAAFPGMAAYAASKAGLTGLAKALAVECGAARVRVNALLPGGTDTPMQRAFTNGAKDAEEAVAGLHALKRVAAPEEIARSALYLASDASSFTTGTALLVDGGVSTQRG